MTTNSKPWSRKHPACVTCGMTVLPHNGHGHCRGCYWRGDLRAVRVRSKGHGHGRVTYGVPDGAPLTDEQRRHVIAALTERYGGPTGLMGELIEIERARGAA